MACMVVQAEQKPTAKVMESGKFRPLGAHWTDFDKTWNI